MIVAAWIILILSILFIFNTKFNQGSGGVILLIFFFVVIFFSATIIWEDIHSFRELKELF